MAALAVDLTTCNGSNRLFAERLALENTQFYRTLEAPSREYVPDNPKQRLLIKVLCTKHFCESVQATFQ
jgi:hypothetical protein